MNYSIDNNSKQPAYLQLYNMLVEDIVSGAYPLHSKLPSKRFIAEETGLSIITVEHALALVCDEGYVEARQRSGYFVIYRESDFQVNHSENYVNQSKNREDLRYVNHNSNISNASAIPASTRIETAIPASSHHHNTYEFPYSVLAKTMRKVLSDLGDEILVKSPNAGLPSLREEICAYLFRSRGIKVEARQIIIGSGAEYLYGLIAQLLGENHIIALEDPSYDKIRRVYESMGVGIELLPLGADGIITAKLDASKATVLHVTPFNSFPTGITVGISKKKEYLQWANKRNGYIVEDNYDSELTVSSKLEDPLFLISKGERVIYVNTFSRTIAPSMRIGYMVLPHSLVETFEEKLGFYSCTVPLFDQQVLAELIRSGDYERHVNRIRRAKRKNNN